MSRRILIFSTLLAWCCLAVPWLVCESDCRDGSVQLLVHDCHSVTHHSCGSAEEVATCDSGVQHDGDICLEHDGESHRTLVFQQTTPDPIECPDFEWTVSGLIDYPKALDQFVAQACEMVIDPAVDPPGFEVQAAVQLRTDVLLR